MHTLRVAHPFITLLSVVTLACSSLLLTAAGPADPSPAFPPGARFVPNEVLLQFQPGTTDSQKSSVRSHVGANQKEQIRTSRQGDLELDTLPSGLVLADAIRGLKSDPSVAFAEPNWIYTHQATSDDPYFTNGSLWGMAGNASSPANQFGSQAAEAWLTGYTGSSSVYVGVIDEGIDLGHADLAANIWTNPFENANGNDDDGNGYADDLHGWDFVHGDSSIFDAPDGDDHGTHVSGTIGGVGGNGQGVAGVNWNVKLISAKFLGPSGGSTSNAVRAVDYLTDLKARHGLNIVATSNSWGGGGYSQALHDAIIRAARQNILFVASAGNNGTDNDTTIYYPADYDTTQKTTSESAASYNAVIPVAAIDSAGNKASWSSYGAKTVPLGAPGVNIYSTLPGNGYGSYSGTSMAAPHVSGAVALYASTHSGATGTSIRTAILGSVAPTSSLSGKTVTGGRLDVGALMGSSPPLPAPPDFSLSASPNSLSIATGGSSSFSVSVTPVSGFADTVTLSASGPAGLTVTPSSTTVASPYLSTAFTVSSSTAGSYTITVNANGGGLTRSTRVSVTVTAPDFSISASPGTRTIKRGTTTSYSVTVNSSGGFASPVALSVSGLPDGASASFSNANPTPSAGTNLTIQTGTATGRFTLAITGTGGGVTHATKVTLQVK